MKTSSEIKPKDNITESQKKYLDNLFYKSIENNPLADRLRRCPGCGLYHFVTHRSSDFHTPKCADDHQNLKKTHEAHALKVEEIEDDEKAKVSDVGKSESINPYKEVLTSIVSQHQKEANINTKLKNEEILKRLLADREEIAINPQELFSTGFDETSYDMHIKFPGSELNFCVYGEYCVCWQDVDQLIINLLKKMLWAHM